jgi:hypothetical protein
MYIECKNGGLDNPCESTLPRMCASRVGSPIGASQAARMFGMCEIMLIAGPLASEFTACTAALVYCTRCMR